MRAQFIHLSGPRRGRTDTPTTSTVTVGSDPASEVRFPVGAGVAPHHAFVTFDDCGCDFLIRAVEGKVFLNHEEIREAILEHGDLLEFGAGGPKARFRVFRSKGAACKPVRAMLADAAAVGRESGVVASGTSFARDLLTQATLTLKIGFPLLVLGLLGLVYAGGFLGGGRATERRLHDELEAMRRDLADLGARQTEQVTRGEVDTIRKELEQRAGELRELAAQQTLVRTVLETSSRGVCLVHGAWGFRVPESMRAGGQEFVNGPDGARVEFEYTGSGFHVGGGRIVTNRHVALPWDSQHEFDDMRAAGFEPVMLRLTVTFPAHQPIPVDASATRVRTTDLIDVAVLTSAVPEDVPSLELDSRTDAEIAGETVLVVGYPTGVNALLAKAEEDVSRAIIDASGGDLGKIIDGLASRNAISPIVTRGVLSEVRDRRLVYDAETTSGGSGGPVIGTNGRVLGVNFAILVGFGGSNFGVPIRYASALLD